MQATRTTAVLTDGTTVVPRTVKGLSLVSLFNDFASEMVYPLLPAFVTGALGGGPVALGALDGAADLTAALLKWVSGALADRPGWRRPLILIGYLTAVLIRPLISVAGAASQVIGFRVIDRIGKGLRTPPRDALIADVTPPAARGRAFGFHRGADHFGAILGSLAAWYFLSSGANVRQVIAWSALPGLVAFVVLALVLAGRAAKTDAGGRSPEHRNGFTGAASPGEAGFWPPILALAALTFCRIPEALLLLRLQQAGVAVALVPLVWAALHVVRSGASYPGGRLVDSVGPRIAVTAGAVLFALAIGVMGRETGAVGVTVAFLVFGGVAGLTESAERSLVARLAPVHIGRGFGAYHAVTGLAALPAAVMFGELYQRWGSQIALGVSAAAVLLAAGWWLVVSPAGTAESTS
jgi:MFS-type transporter involved in bile tolerance (Atg22 family)